MKLKRILTLAAIVVLGLVLYFVGFEYYDRLKWTRDYPGHKAAEGAVDGALAALAEVPIGVMKRMRRLCEKFGEFDRERMEVAVDTLKDIEVDDEYEYYELFDHLDEVMTSSNGNPGLIDRPVETGDEFIDRVMTELYEFASHQHFRSLRHTSYAIIQRRILNEWEEDFADDLRFWELRFLQEKLYTELDHERAMGYLQEARDRGLATADTLLVMFLAEYEMIPGGVNVDSDGADTPFNEASGDLLALLDQAAVMDPDHAWPHYLRSLLYYRTGERELALDSLDRGNRCENFEFPRLQLVREVEAGLTAEHPLGCAITSGIFQEYMIMMPSFDEGTFKVFEMECQEQAAESGRMDSLQPWHEFGCRYISSWPANTLHTLQGINFLKRPLNDVSDPEKWTITDDQRETLQRTRGMITTGTKPIGSSAHNRISLNEIDLMIGAGGSTGYRVAMHLDSEIMATLITENIVPIVDDLLLVSYPDLAMPDSLRDYPALRHEDIRAFKEGTFVPADDSAGSEGE